MINNNTVEKLSKRLKWYKVSVIVLLVFICLIAGLWLYTKESTGRTFLDKFSLLDPAREFIAPENYVINIQNLRDYLNNLENQYPDSISIYYEQINSGANISVNKETRLFPASLSKLVQAILITKKVEDGVWTWDKELVALPEDISSDSGELYKTIGDKPMTVEKLLEELLVNSDNTAQNIFKHYLDFDNYILFQQATGLEDLYNEKGFISAKEYTRILRVLYTSNFLKSENSEKILEYMSNASFKDYLSQGIPSDVKFAHKYGENKDYNLFADSGIVYVPNKPYMLTVMLKGKDSSPQTRAWAVSLMKEISQRAYQVSNFK